MSHLCCGLFNFHLVNSAFCCSVANPLSRGTTTLPRGRTPPHAVQGLRTPLLEAVRTALATDGTTRATPTLPLGGGMTLRTRLLDAPALTLARLDQATLAVLAIRTPGRLASGPTRSLTAQTLALAPADDTVGATRARLGAR